MYALDALKNAAKKRGLSINKVAKLVGVAPQTINASASRHSQPRIDRLVKLLDACDYTLITVPKGEMPRGALKID